MNAAFIGYVVAYVLMYGLITRLILFFAMRKKRSFQRVLAVHGVLIFVWGPLISQQMRTEPVEVGIGFLCAVAFWFVLDAWRVGRKRKTIPVAVE